MREAYRPKIKREKTGHSHRIVCIVPCFNEAARLPAVLNALLLVSGLDQILCVDDGSKDGSPAVVQRDFPQVGLLALQQNRGKAGAVLAGVQSIRSDYVLLMDADLERLLASEIEFALAIARLNPQVDMIILRRSAEEWWARLLRGDDLFSGQRLIRREDLHVVLAGNRVRGYQLEVALNQYMIKKDKVVWIAPLNAKHAMASQKIGSLAGIWKEVHMFLEILVYLGPRGLIRQFLWFPPQVGKSPRTKNASLPV
jgi:glycosyltransferase involved in cell wall biosynthesis